MFSLVLLLIFAFVALMWISGKHFTQLVRCLFFTTVAIVFKSKLLGRAPPGGWADTRLKQLDRHLVKLVDDEIKKL